MRIPLSKPTNGIVIRIDWKAYYLKFVEQHGGFPVHYLGRLLFRDGWMYSATDHKGPEWNPLYDNEGKEVPPEKLIELKVAYWSLRLKSLRLAHRELVQAFDSLKQLQLSRSAPMQHTVTYVDDEGIRVTKSVDLNLQALETRMEWAAKDVEECELHLAQLVPNVMNSVA